MNLNSRCYTRELQSTRRLLHVLLEKMLETFGANKAFLTSAWIVEFDLLESTCLALRRTKPLKLFTKEWEERDSLP